MDCSNPNAYDAAGYRGVDISLPAYETFAAALASGGEIPELQLLYRAWAAPQQKTTAAERLYRRQRQTVDSKAALAVSNIQQQTHNTKHSDSTKHPEDVVLHEQPSQTLPMALQTVRMDHAIPCPVDAAAVQTITSNHICSACRTRCNLATQSTHKKAQQKFEYCCAATVSARSAGNGSHPPTSQEHDGIIICQQQLHLNCLQEQQQQPCSPRNSCRNDIAAQRALQQFCCELQQLQHIQRTSLLQQQHQRGHSSNGTYYIHPSTLQQLKQVAEDCKEQQQLPRAQPLQQQAHCVEWQLTACAAQPVWQLLKQIPFFNRLAPSLGPAVCQQLLLRRLAAGSTVVQPRFTDNTSTSSNECISDPLIIVLAGELELMHVNSGSNTTAVTGVLLGPGSVICSSTFPAAAAAVHTSASCSGIQAGRGVTVPAAPNIVVCRRLAAELLVLTSDALAAAVKWWGAATLNWMFQSRADGLTFDGPDFPHFFITQQAQYSVLSRLRAASSVEHSKQQQTVGAAAVSASSSSNSVSARDAATAAGGNSGSCFKSAEENVGCSYAELHALWQFLPVPVQQSLLLCCSCLLLPVGCLLDGTAAAAAAAAAAGGGTGVGCAPHPSDAAGSFKVAAGVLLEVQHLPASGQAAGSATTAAADGGNPAAVGAILPALSPRWSTLTQHVTGSDLTSTTEATTRSSGSSNPVSSSSSPRRSGNSSINAGNAAAGSKWDELLSASGVGQHGRLQTPHFKALSLQEQLECLAAWSGLQIAVRKAAGTTVWLELPAGGTEALPSADSSMAHATSTSRGSSSSSQTALVAAETCLFAAIAGQQLMLAVDALVRMQQQRQAMQAQLLLLKSSPAAVIPVSAPTPFDAAGTAAAAVPAETSVFPIHGSAQAAAAEVPKLASSDKAADTALGIVGSIHGARCGRAADLSWCGVSDTDSGSCQASGACPGAAGAATSCDGANSSNAWCTAGSQAEAATSIAAAQEQPQQLTLQKQQKQQQEAQVLQHDGCSGSRETGLSEQWLCPCCEMQRARMVLCSDVQEHQHQQKQGPRLSGAFQQQMLTPLLLQFGESEDGESSETGNSTGNNKIHDQQQRDLVVAFKQTMLAPGPLHSMLSADGRTPMSEGLIPVVQVHSYESKPASNTDSVLVSTSSSLGAGLLSVNRQRSSRVATAAVAAAGGSGWQFGTAAAISDSSKRGHSQAASAREEWVRSVLFDPFGMLKPQLVLCQRMHARQQQLQAKEQKLAGCCDASTGKCSQQGCDLQQDGMRVNGSSHIYTSSASCRTADSTAGVYISLSAVSNQRRLGGFVMPGRQQIKQRILHEEQKQTQQPHQDREIAQMDASGQNTSGNGGVACSMNSISAMKHVREATLKASGLEDSSDEEEGFRLVTSGATDGLGVVDCGQGSKRSKHRWTVPAYSSETGYQHGLFDEETGTMYID